MIILQAYVSIQNKTPRVEEDIFQYYTSTEPYKRQVYKKIQKCC
jgi:hypothetical protein